MKEISCIVSGRVQMVMFRDFVRRKASNLQLVGIVKNMPNGTVHVTAQGGEQKLQQLIQLLNTGSVLSRVNEVAVTWREPQGVYDSFVIEY